MAMIFHLLAEALPPETPGGSLTASLGFDDLVAVLADFTLRPVLCPGAHHSSSNHFTSHADRFL
jgi:hypothetical protein